MTFAGAGAGGPKNEECARWLTWSAFSRGDRDALEELGALLGSYTAVASFVYEFMRAKTPPTAGE
jgi:hypothetical protein